jgi:hypothetical protein
MTDYRRKTDCRFDTFPPSQWKTDLINEIQRDNAKRKRNVLIEAMAYLVAFLIGLSFLAWLPVSAWGSSVYLTLSGVIPSPARAHFSE